MYDGVEMMRGIKKMCMKNQHQFNGLRVQNEEIREQNTDLVGSEKTMQ
jgi:hypothetical protein